MNIFDGQLSLWDMNTYLNRMCDILLSIWSPLNWADSMMEEILKSHGAVIKLLDGWMTALVAGGFYPHIWPNLF